jgi:LysM repeat protein
MRLRLAQVPRGVAVFGSLFFRRVVTMVDSVAGTRTAVAVPQAEKATSAVAPPAQPQVESKTPAFVPKPAGTTASPPANDATKKTAEAQTTDMTARNAKARADLAASQEVQLKTALESFANGKTPQMDTLYRVLVEVKESNPHLLQAGIGLQVATKFELTSVLQQADTYTKTTQLQAGEFGKYSALLEEVKELDASLLESQAAQNLSKKLGDLQDAITKAPPVDTTPGAAKPTQAQEVAAAQKKLTEAAASYAKTPPQREDAIKLLKEVAAVDVNLLKFGPGKEVRKAFDDIQRPMIPKELADLDALTNQKPLATRDEAVQVGMFLNEVQRLDPAQLKTAPALSLIAKLQKAKQAIEAAEAATAQGAAKEAGAAAAPAAGAAAAPAAGAAAAPAAGAAAAPAAGAAAAPAAEAVAAEPASAVPETWTIKPGDTLWALAKKKLGPGADNTAIANLVKKVAQENNIADPNKIYPNQVFTLPATEKPAAATPVEVPAAEAGGAAPAAPAPAAPAPAAPASAAPGRQPIRPDPAAGPASGPAVDKRNENYGNEGRANLQEKAEAEANYSNEGRANLQEKADAEADAEASVDAALTGAIIAP